MVTQDQDDPDLWSTPPNRTPPLPLPNAPSPRGTRSLRSKRRQSESSPEIVSGISINSTAATQGSGESENPFYEPETDNPVCPPAPRKKIRVKPKLVPGKIAMVKRGRRLMLDNVPDSPPFGVSYRPRLLFANRTPSPPPSGQPMQPSSKVVIVVDDDDDGDDDEKLGPLSQPENTPVRSAPSRRASKSTNNDATKQVPTLISTPTPRSIHPTTRTRKRSNSISESSTSTSSPKGESSSTVTLRYHRKTATPSPSPKQRRRRRSLSEDRLTMPLVGTTVKGIKRKTREEGSGRLPETPKTSTSGRWPLKSPRTPSKDAASTVVTPRKGTRGRRGVIGLVSPSTPSPETPVTPVDLFGDPFIEVSGKGKSVSRRRSSVATKELARQNFGVLLHGKRIPVKPSFYDEPLDGFSTPEVKPRMLWPSKSPTPTPTPSFSTKHDERVEPTEAVANESERENENAKEKEAENKVLHSHAPSSSQPLITQYATKKKRAWRSSGKMI